MHDIQDLFATIIRRRYESMLDEGQKLEVVEFLFFIQNDVRLNQIASREQVEAVWGKVRDEEVLTDFLFLIIQDLAFHLDEAKWEDTIERLARAYTIVYESSIEEETPIGDETLERMGAKKTIQGFLKLYPWLMAMVLIDMVDVQKALGVTVDDLKMPGEGDA